VFRRIAIIGLLCSLVPGLNAQLPAFGHVFLVVEENHGYSSVIGNPAMPYLNSLASQYALANNYFANTHPSIGNYFMLTTGEVISNSDSYAATVSTDNIVRQLAKAKVSWKSYAESLPSAGYIGGDVYPYAKHHNPFAYLSDVKYSTAQLLNLVPFSQFAADLAAGTLPRYSYIVPNLQNDAHDCPAGMVTCTDAQKLANADTWLQNNIDPVIKSAAFQNDGLLLIVFDEAVATDPRNGGGHVPAIIVSPKLKAAGYRAQAMYQHQSVLRLIAEGLGLTNFPGSSKFVPNMAEFFGTATWACPTSEATPSVAICLPNAGSILVSPVRVMANALSTQPILSLLVTVDGTAMSPMSSNRLDTLLTLTLGTHTIAVQATDAANVTFSTSTTVRVGNN
jgi:acid phosphatase